MLEFKWAAESIPNKPVQHFDLPGGLEQFVFTALDDANSPTKWDMVLTNERGKEMRRTMTRMNYRYCD